MRRNLLALLLISVPAFGSVSVGPEQTLVDNVSGVPVAADAHLLLWSEGSLLFATHVGANERLRVSGGLEQRNAAIATDGSSDLVVWQEGVGVRARVITAAAMTPVVDLSTETSDAPNAIWTGGEYLVTWTRPFFDPDGAPDEELMAVRIARDGTPVEQPRHITASPNFATGYAQIIDTAAGLKAIFLHGTPALFRGILPVLQRQIIVAPVTSNGDFIGTPVAVTNDPERGAGAMRAAAAPDGSLAIAWAAAPLDYHFPANRIGAIFTPELQVTRSFDFTPQSATPAVAWSTGSFFVAWTTDQVYVIAGTAGTPIALTSDADSKSAPLLVPIQNGVLAVYSHGTRIVAREVTSVSRRRAIRR